jgi:hypothetical protein
MNASTQSYTLNPETMVQYTQRFYSSTLKVAMKKPSLNPRIRMINQSSMFWLMKMKKNLKETHPLGDICQEASTPGCKGLVVSPQKMVEMKRTF